MPRTVMTVIGADPPRKETSLFLIVATRSGYGAY